jgi:hypothetical protein
VQPPHTMLAAHPLLADVPERVLRKEVGAQTGIALTRAGRRPRVWGTGCACREWRSCPGACLTGQVQVALFPARVALAAAAQHARHAPS